MRARTLGQETPLQKLGSSCPPLCSLRRTNALLNDTTPCRNTSSSVHMWAEPLACLLLDEGTARTVREKRQEGSPIHVGKQPHTCNERRARLRRPTHLPSYLLQTEVIHC